MVNFIFIIIFISSLFLLLLLLFDIWTIIYRIRNKIIWSPRGQYFTNNTKNWYSVFINNNKVEEIVTFDTFFTSQNADVCKKKTVRW